MNFFTAWLHPYLFWVGVVLGAGGICVQWALVRFLSQHGKALLVLAALVAAASLAALAFGV